MQPTGGISTSMVRAALGLAASRGGDVPSGLAAVGLAPAELEEQERRIPRETVEKLFEHFAMQARDRDYGLHLAERLADLPEPDVLFYAARSSPTLGESIRLTVRYYHILNDAAFGQLDVKGDVAQLFFTQRSGDPARHSAEFVLAMFYLRARHAAGPEFTLREVLFAHRPPEGTAEHERIFQAPVRFEQSTNALVFDRAHLDRTLSTADPALARILDRYLQQLGGPSAGSRGFIDQVRQHLVATLKGTCPAIEDIAVRMHMSPRSLQRRLQDQGTNYQDVLNDVRRDLALRNLKDRNLAIGEIAFLLGFSDVSTFHRAFKRWTQQTPAEFRRQQQGAAPG